MVETWVEPVLPIHNSVRTNCLEYQGVKFPELTPQVAKKGLKLSCCDRCNRAEWVEAVAMASFCSRCGTRRRPATKTELEQFKASLIAAAQAAAAEANNNRNEG